MMLRLQWLQGATAVALYEEHVRFMILAEHELSGHRGDSFNSHLNLEQINKVLFPLASDEPAIWIMMRCHAE